MPHRPGLIVALLGLLANPGSALGEVVMCRVTGVSADLAAHIGGTIVVDYSRDTGVARVDDGFPLADTLPHRGKVARDSARILTFTWGQPPLQVSGRPYAYPITVRMSIRRGSGRAILSANHANARERVFDGRATCRER